MPTTGSKKGMTRGTLGIRTDPKKGNDDRDPKDPCGFPKKATIGSPRNSNNGQ